MSYRRDKWRQYSGDEPEPGSSEDEAYAAVDTKVAYTRQSVQERAEKWDAIEAFEAYKAARTTSKTLHPPKHRGLCASVRPQQGAEALVSFVCKPRDGGKSEIGGTRVSVVAGEEHGEKWKQVLSKEVLDMRRGERIEADIDDELKLDCCLHAVRVSRQLAPVDAEVYKGHGTVSSKRMEAPKPGGNRPQFGGTATVRLVIADDDRDDDALFKASEGVDPQNIKLGQGDVCEGLEVAVLAMRPGEGCIVTCDGAYGDPCYAVRKVGLGPAIRAAVRLDAVTDGDEDAAYLKERGAMLVAEGECRRAEACFTRAARRAEAQLKALDDDDDEAFAKLKDVLARCLLNVALCCKKRNGRRDEIAVLDGALGVLGDDVDEALVNEVEAAMSPATLLLRAKARLRRGAARGVLGDADAAAQDLTAADALAARIVDELPAAAALRRDVVRERRVQAAAAARRRRREKAAFKGKELFDERDAAAREASEAAAKARLAAEEARRDAEGCRRAQAIAAQAPDDEEVEIGDIRRL